ncbi:MAG TPA: 7-cyano-7-deazaguanine synthase [Vicinamibacterales bacterium]|nr:7-cyano-7-deazaguanine synthase [Vicinamibacterales bacterium]
MAASAVLFSGGLDSAVLLALERRDYDRVWPVHVRSGFAWEDEERLAIDRLLAAPVFASGVAPLTTLSVDMRDTYPAAHWALTGQPPAYDTPDEDVYLDGRNIVLLSKAAVFCRRAGVHRMAMGTLHSNPFPDATPAFFAAITQALSLGLDHALEIATPLVGFHKDRVVKLGAELGVPMELSMSCMNPQGARHCGQCSKCRERQDAFREAGVPDPTDYAGVWAPRLR